MISEYVKFDSEGIFYRCGLFISLEASVYDILNIIIIRNAKLVEILEAFPEKMPDFTFVKNHVFEETIQNLKEEL